MEYIEIDTYANSKDPQGTARDTILAVGKLIDRLPKYDKDLPVIAKLSEGYYGGFGCATKRESW